MVSLPSQTLSHSLQQEPLKVAHISDLHFGSVDTAAVEALVAHLQGFQPDLLVVTGDLTQRARKSEFRAARDFLERIPTPKLVVPGNHDIAPFFRPASRLLRPLARFEDWVGGTGFVEAKDMAALGIDTVSRWRAKEGSLSRRELARLREELSTLPHGFRILASHHPLIHPRRAANTRHGAELLSLLEDSRIDVALSGHLHQSFAGPRAGQSARAVPLGTLFVEASTATSTRLRGHVNAYNQLEIDARTIQVFVCGFDGTAFARLGPEGKPYLRAFGAQPLRGPGDVAPREPQRAPGAAITPRGDR